MNCRPIINLLIAVILLTGSIALESTIAKTSPSRNVSISIGLNLEVNNTNESIDGETSGDLPKDVDEAPHPSDYIVPIEEKPSIKVRMMSALSISDASVLDDTMIKKLSDREFFDRKNFDDIAATAKLVESDRKKRVIVDEVIDMDKAFMNEFIKKGDSRQVEEYLEYVTQANETINVNIDDYAIENLFRKDISIDAFIEMIW